MFLFCDDTVHVSVSSSLSPLPPPRPVPVPVPVSVPVRPPSCHRSAHLVPAESANPRPQASHHHMGLASTSQTACAAEQHEESTAWHHQLDRTWEHDMCADIDMSSHDMRARM